MLLPSPKLPDLSTMLYGSCPYYTEVSIATFMADSLVTHVVDSHYSNVVRCYVIKLIPSATEWSQAYADDKDTNFIIARLKVTTPWEEEEIRRVHKGYWHQLREKKIVFKHGRLVMFSSTSSSHRFLTLIVVPTSLRRTVFVAYHASGAGAHMGGWKTMPIIRMRFYWPHMRKMILDWVNMCTACIPARSQVRTSSGLVHSWPVTTPFSIISVDIWSPGDIKNCYGQKSLMNVMCDMCQ